MAHRADDGSWAHWCAAVAAVCLAIGGLARATAQAGIERAGADLIRPGLYRLDIAAPPESWPITVRVSARPDRVDPDGPVSIARSTPVTIGVTGATRVYFHLLPNAGRPRVVALRRLPLEGAINFRDLGGYRTVDGRYVKWGMVYRSDDLSELTVSDYVAVNALGLRLVCDLRTAGERQRAPTTWQGAGPEVLLAPVLEDATITLAAPTTTAASQATASAAADARAAATAVLKARLAEVKAGRATPQNEPLYRRFVLEFADSYAAVFKRLADGDFPVLGHCTAGQDRTGLFAAIVLRILGVPSDTVMEDYLLTNRYRRPDSVIERTRLDLQKRLGLAEAPAMSTVRWMQDIHPSMLNRAYAAMDEGWGSFDSYVRTGLRVSAEQLSRLRAALLEN